MVPGNMKRSSLELSAGIDQGGSLQDLASADAHMELLVGEAAIRDGLQSTHLLEMFDYYTSLQKAANGMPPRVMFNPAEKPRHLPNIFMVELERQPDGSADYRYRVFGTGLAVLFGCEMTGKLVSEFPAQNRAQRTRRILDRVVELREPLRTAGHFMSRNGMPIFGESVALPFGEGGHVTHVLADLDYDRA